MLASTRNKETLSILQRLRNQGAPPSGGINLGPLMGEEEVEEQDGEELDPSNVDTMIPTKKKRRLRASGAGGEY